MDFSCMYFLKQQIAIAIRFPLLATVETTIKENGAKTYDSEDEGKKKKERDNFKPNTEHVYTAIEYFMLLPAY